MLDRASKPRRPGVLRERTPGEWGFEIFSWVFGGAYCAFVNYVLVMALWRLLPF